MTTTKPYFDKKNIVSFFQKEEIKKLSKEIVKPIVNIIYDEIYPYIWFLCVYNVFLIFITLANLFLIIRLVGSKEYAVLPRPPFVSA
jgi:hypothetical protein